MASKELREPTFLVLAALANGPQHGYALMQSIQESTQGEIMLRPGTLYTALDRLTADALIAVTGEEIVDGRPRRYYDLTDAGSTVLTEAVDRMEARAKAARTALASRRRTREVMA